MQNFTEKLHDELKAKLQLLEDDPHSEKFRAEQRIGLIIKTINQILKELETYRFPNEKEEITYFKSVLPSTISLLVYYDGKNDWESVERLGTQKANRTIWNNCLERSMIFSETTMSCSNIIVRVVQNLTAIFFFQKEIWMEKTLI